MVTQLCPPLRCRRSQYLRPQKGVSSDEDATCERYKPGRAPNRLANVGRSDNLPPTKSRRATTTEGSSWSTGSARGQLDGAALASEPDSPFWASSGGRWLSKRNEL